MNATYEWLYENYAVPKLEDLKKSGNAQMERLVQSFQLPSWNCIEVLDQLAYLRFQWGQEMFTIGVQMGMQMALRDGL